MGYKLLGFVVWRGAKWYVGRRVDLDPRKLAAAAAAGGLAIAGGLAVAQRRAAH